jgi:protein SCO1/2
MRLFLLLLCILAVALVANAIFRPSTLTDHRTHSYGKAAIGGDFTLTDTHGHTVRSSDFQGKALLVYMGYSHCPDICPATLATMSQALTLLGDKSTHAVFVFITLDPERDTPQVLSQFLSQFDPRIIGLTGSPEAIAQAAKAYKVFYAKVAPNATGNYPISHSGFLYLMDKQGDYVTHFGTNVTAQQIASAVKQIIR